MPGLGLSRCHTIARGRRQRDFERLVAWRDSARSIDAHVCSVCDGEQLPGPRYTFEFVLTALCELDAGAGDEVLHHP